MTVGNETMSYESPEAEPEKPPQPKGRGWSRLLVNLCIGLSLVAAGYAAYSFMMGRGAVQKESEQAAGPARKIIQLDVLNGCGARGAAARFTSFLRNSGFDVVEMKNYKVRTMQKTLVVDRIGDLASARRVATALGVSQNNVVQQINPDYFVDVSVIIGADYSTLEPLRH